MIRKNRPTGMRKKTSWAWEANWEAHPRGRVASKGLHASCNGFVNATPPLHPPIIEDDLPPPERGRGENL